MAILHKLLFLLLIGLLHHCCGAFALTLTAELLNSEGTVLNTAQLSLPSLGHTAIYLDQFAWNETTDLSSFEGLLRVSSDGRISATVIQTRPGQFATMPVANKSLD